MEVYQKFLFYYSLIVSSFLLAVSLFFLPQPQSFFALALFTPVTLYFWFKFTLAEEKSPYRWSLKMLGVLLAAGLMGLFAFWLVGRQPAENQKSTLSESVPTPAPATLGEESNGGIITILEEIKTEISQIKAEQRATRELLGLSGSAKEASEILNAILEQATGSASP
jgi:energy-coupling factor transporter transmembrane protein EcfT